MNTVIVATLQQTFDYVSYVIGILGVLIVVYGALRSLVRFISKSLKNDSYVNFIRIELGHYLTLGLEFFVAKDVIDTVIHPTFEELAKLAIIVAIRVILSIFLARELREVEKEMKLHGQRLDAHAALHKKFIKEKVRE